MKLILIFMLWLLAGCNDPIVGKVRAEPVAAKVQVSKLEEVSIPKEEPAPKGVAKDEPKMSKKQMRLLGQLSDGIFRIKEKRDHGQWYICGILLSEEEQRNTSIEIALALMENLESINLDVDPWGILGTIYNESGFDPCALGLFPRKWAYAEGILDRPVTHISHTRDEVWSVMNHPEAVKRYKYSGFDLGFCQILTRFYPNQEDELLSLKPGIRLCVIEMQARARRHKTNMPWLFWRGSETQWYLTKVNKHIARMKGKRRR